MSIDGLILFLPTELLLLQHVTSARMSRAVEGRDMITYSGAPVIPSHDNSEVQKGQPSE
jgi:hypothetical protein